MPWGVFGDRLSDTSDRQRAVELIHGFRWARNRAVHEGLLKVEGIGGGFAAPFVTPLVSHPAERWLWDDASEARPEAPDPAGEAGYGAQLLGREIQETVAEIRQLYELAG